MNKVPNYSNSEFEHLHRKRISVIDDFEGPLLAISCDYPAGYSVRPHRHRRAQFLYARAGVVMVASSQGRWMVPPEHALWIPPEISHSVHMIGNVIMLSAYIEPGAIGGLPHGVRVVSPTALLRSLIIEAVALRFEHDLDRRATLITELLLLEIPRVPEQPLGLPFPADPRLASLCRDFLDKPSPHLAIDQWAQAMAMSRRAFTRVFRRETGLSLATWRQQACLFTAVPRLANGEAVTSVALDLGYESVAAFTTMFKRMLGASPRSYVGSVEER